MITGGPSHTLFLDFHGALWTCGRNNEGQLGHGNTEDLSVAQKIEGLPPCVWIAGGWFSSACVSHDGRLFCWGQGTHGQLGQGNTMSHFAPQEVFGVPPIRSVACGEDYTVALAQDGTVWAFGANYYGQLGLGHQDQVTTPTQVAGILARQVACGCYHTMVLDTNGTLYAWGHGKYGELGISNITHSTLPTRINCLVPVKSISCGGHFSMVIGTDGSVWTIGYNPNGQLGLGDTIDRSKLHKIGGVSAELGGGCGWKYGQALDAQGRLWMWGKKDMFGINRPRPMVVAQGITMAQANPYATFALQNDQILVGGRNDYGQLWLGHTQDRTTLTINSNIRVDMLGGWLWAEYRQPLGLSIPELSALQEISKFVQQHMQMTEQEAPAAPLSLLSWQQCADLVASKKQAYDRFSAGRRAIQAQHAMSITQSQQKIAQLEAELVEERATLKRLQEAEGKLTIELTRDEARSWALTELADKSFELAKSEEQRTEELNKLLSSRSLVTLGATEMDLVWWRMDVARHMTKITGEILMAKQHDASFWTNLGLSDKEASRVRFMTPMMSLPDGMKVLTHLDEEDCVVCSNHSVQQTINLMKERGIKVDSQEIRKEGWTTPELIYASLKEGKLGLTTVSHAEAMSKLQELREAHERHVSELVHSREPTRPSQHSGRPERRDRNDQGKRAHKRHPYQRQEKRQ